MKRLTSLNDTLRRKLEKDGWTVEKLAQTTVFDLEKQYKHIGRPIARKIIDEAIDLTTPELKPEKEQAEGPAMSVRVKRIKEQNQE